MNVNIRTHYRIVKAQRDGKTYYIPQCRVESDPINVYQNFQVATHNRTASYGQIAFTDLKEAKEFLKKEKSFQDEVVYTL